MYLDHLESSKFTFCDPELPISLYYNQLKTF